MNIFASSADPELCAQALDDRRMVKLIVETGQLLSMWARHRGYIHDNLYSRTHHNHPCVKWVCAEPTYARWLWEHFQALVSEYQKRYSKIDHLTWVKIGPLTRQLIEKRTPKYVQLDEHQFCNCTPHKDMHTFDAYRLTLNEKWVRGAKCGRPPIWTKCQPPAWCDITSVRDTIVEYRLLLDVVSESVNKQKRNRDHE